MKTVFAVVPLLLTLALAAMALPANDKDVPPFPGTLVNARYVYVASFDGDQFNPAVLPEDRSAIAATQDAIEKWGKWTIVYKPAEADIVLMVQSRASDDTLAVYDAHGWPKDDYLWRMSAHEGLQKGETPLLTRLRKAYEQATKAK